MKKETSSSTSIPNQICTFLLRGDEEKIAQREATRKGTCAVVSHRKDADGVSSAALVRFLTGANVYLTDYSDMADTLSEVKQSSEVFVCDLGLNKSTFDGFLQELRRLKEEGSSLHYVDHHQIDPAFMSSLKSLGVDVFHSTEECTSALIFQKYENKLGGEPRMKIVACCGAITDYMDRQPVASKLIGSFDRQFLLYEATVLSFTIAIIGRESKESNQKLIELANDLARGALPHEIKNAPQFAQLYASRASELIERVKKEGKRMKNYAYFLTKESATGNVANFLMGAFQVPVGVAIREEEPGYYEISLRASEESNSNLGSIVGRITTKLNGSGGGHPKASGARIRQEQLQEFLEELDRELES